MEHSDNTDAARSVPRSAGWFATLGVAGAVLSSACCIVPLVLFGLGISGAWIGNLTALEPYKPIFLMFSAALIVAGFVSLRRRRRACAADGYCASPLSTRITTGALWLAVVVLVLAAAWPYLVPYLLVR